MAERAERLGAQLELLSKPGRGTTVVLTLPRTQAAQAAQAAQALAA